MPFLLSQTGNPKALQVRLGEPLPGTKEKALRKENAVQETFALCGARGASAAPARKILKKFDQNLSVFRMGFFMSLF